jgi:hypothetical protein
MAFGRRGSGGERDEASEGERGRVSGQPRGDALGLALILPRRRWRRGVATGAASAPSAREETTREGERGVGPAGLGQCTVHLVQSSLAPFSFSVLFSIISFLF